MTMLAIDTETTGLDHFHGTMPFIVTTCDETTYQQTWEWYVDPVTRQPEIPSRDLEAIRKLIDSAETLVLHNSKFDAHALCNVIPDLVWNWDKVVDTMIASHVLCSNAFHNLTDLAVEYLDRDIEPLEKKMKGIVQEARKKVTDSIRGANKKGRCSPLQAWRIADVGLEDMPGIRSGGRFQKWKADTWLPKTIAQEFKYEPHHRFWKATLKYAQFDSAITMALWPIMWEKIREQGLEKIYHFRMRPTRIAFEMERRGVSGNTQRTIYMRDKYEKKSVELGKECVSIAKGSGYDLILPKKGANDSLRGLMLEHWKLEPVYAKKSKSGEPTLNKDAMAHYQKTLPEGSTQRKFIDTLLKKSNSDATLTYVKDYIRFMVKGVGGSYIIHPNFNLTGTDTLRWSSNNPNAQNVKHGKDDEEFSLRSCFGPAPDREWWALDAKNIELRIPFYESGEEAMIELFERSNEPPFYGSNHILVFSILWPKLWSDAVKQVGIEHAAEFCKKEYKSTQYAWTKNFNFAVQYGSGEKNADITAHQQGAYKLINQRFKKLAALNRKYVNLAQKFGYVETLPDRTIDPLRGYPVQCTMIGPDRVLPTVPLNYHVQSTAMWLTARAMIDVEEVLVQWRKEGFDAFITLQVHDEIVIDTPKRENPSTNPRRSNLGRMREIQRVMEKIGGDFVPVIPTLFGLEYHEFDWGKGTAF